MQLQHSQAFAAYRAEATESVQLHHKIYKIIEFQTKLYIHI